MEEREGQGETGVRGKGRWEGEGERKEKKLLTGLVPLLKAHSHPLWPVRGLSEAAWLLRPHKGGANHTPVPCRCFSALAQAAEVTALFVVLMNTALFITAFQVYKIQPRS